MTLNPNLNPKNCIIMTSQLLLKKLFPTINIVSVLVIRFIIYYLFDLFMPRVFILWLSMISLTRLDKTANNFKTRQDCKQLSDSTRLQTTFRLDKTANNYQVSTRSVCAPKIPSRGALLLFQFAPLRKISCSHGNFTTFHAALRFHAASKTRTELTPLWVSVRPLPCEHSYRLHQTPNWTHAASSFEALRNFSCEGPQITKKWKTYFATKQQKWWK